MITFLAEPLTLPDLFGLLVIVFPVVTLAVLALVVISRIRKKETERYWFLKAWGMGMLVGCLAGAVSVGMIRKPKSSMAFFTKGHARQVAERARASAEASGFVPGAPGFVYNSDHGMGRGPDCANARAPGRPYAPTEVADGSVREVLDALGIGAHRPMRAQLTYAVEEEGRVARVTTLVKVSKSVAKARCHVVEYVVRAPEQEGSPARVEGPNRLE